jgi:hypothetical protein
MKSVYFKLRGRSWFDRGQYYSHVKTTAGTNERGRSLGLRIFQEYL